VEKLVFYLFAAVAVLSALMVVLQRRAVFSALSLIACLASMAVLFYQLGAPFIAAIQVIVYAGAIMVLFLFVVMLIDPDSEVFAFKKLRNLTMYGLPLAAVLGLVLYQGVSGWTGTSAPPPLDGGIEAVGMVLFRDYLLPFEVTSILILVAVLGALVLAKHSD
jgi:NADH-quinone oxidoreductase subunit J